MERLIPSPYAIGSSGIMLANTFSNYRQCNDADVIAWEFSPNKCGRIFLLVYLAISAPAQ